MGSCVLSAPVSAGIFQTQATLERCRDLKNALPQVSTRLRSDRVLLDRDAAVAGRALKSGMKVLVLALAACSLCDFGHVLRLLWASFSPCGESVSWPMWKSYHFRPYHSKGFARNMWNRVLIMGWLGETHSSLR